MRRHGAAEILPVVPKSGMYLDTVTACAGERYRVLRDGQTFCAVQANWG